LNTHSNVILSTMPSSYKWALSLWSLHQDPVWTSPSSHTCHMTDQSHSSLFDHPDSAWWEVQIIKLLFMLSPPLPCHFVPLMPKCLTHRSILIHCLFTLNYLCDKTHTE
jgi:hypothetical protein